MWNENDWYCILIDFAFLCFFLYAENYTTLKIHWCNVQRVSLITLLSWLFSRLAITYSAILCLSFSVNPFGLMRWDATSIMHANMHSNEKWWVLFQAWCQLSLPMSNSWPLDLMEMIMGAFFIASERSDRSSPVCLSFFYSSEHFVPRFFMTDWSRRSARIFVGVLCWTTKTSATPICLFICAP